jgi:hypothetical protein
MRLLTLVACVALAGCANSAQPFDEHPYQERYAANIRRQLGVDRTEQRQALCSRNRSPVIGMTTTEVLASCWGEPDHASDSTTAQGKQTIWAYPEGEVTLTNGTVTRIVPRPIT